MSGPEEMEDVCKLFKELETHVIKTRRLEKEIDGLIRKANLLELELLRAFLQEALTGTSDFELSIRDFPVHSPLAFLRAAGKAEPHLREAIRMARELKVPNPPPFEFSKRLGVEAKLPTLLGVERVKLKEVLIRVPPDAEHVLVFVSFESPSGGGQLPLQDVWGFVPQISGRLRELLEEALEQFMRYYQELESLRTRISQQRAKEILMGDL
jgi:hypothetical protein